MVGTYVVPVRAGALVSRAQVSSATPTFMEIMENQKKTMKINEIKRSRVVPYPLGGGRQPPAPDHIYRERELIDISFQRGLHNERDLGMLSFQKLSARVLPGARLLFGCVFCK